MSEPSFVTGGSGFIGGALIERLVGEGRPVRALARSDAAAAKVEAPRRRGGARRARRPRLARRRRRRLRDRLPPRRPPRRVGAVGGLRARQRRGHPQRPRRLRRGRRQALRPLRHRGGADGRRAARPRRRDGAAAARLAGALPGDQGARPSMAVREASRDGFETVVAAAALRLGQGRHDAAAGDGEDGRGRANSPGSEAASTSPTRPTSTTSSRASLLGAEKGRPGEAYFITDGKPVVFRDFVTALLETQGVEPPTAACRPGPRRRWRGSAKPPGSSCRCPASRR